MLKFNAKGSLLYLKICKALSRSPALPELAQSNKNFKISGHELLPSSSKTS